MQEAGNHLLLVEPGPLGKIQHVDAVELVVLALLDQTRDGIGDRGIGGLLQHGKLGLDIAHAANLDGDRAAFRNARNSFDAVTAA